MWEMDYISQGIPKKNSFSFIRTFFCFFVILDHYLILNGISNGTKISSTFSVPVFFILSGFWITFSFLRSSSVGVYFKKRFFKIFPQYLLVIFLCAFGFSFLSSFTIKEYFMNSLLYKYLIANIFTMGFICNSLPGISLLYGINGALWTIKIELGFYIVLPIIVYIIKKIEMKKGKSLRNILILLFCLYLFSILFHFFISFLVSKYNLPGSLKNQLPSLFCYFAAGMICFYALDWILKYGKIAVFPALAICLIYYTFKFKFLFVLFPLSLSVIIIWLGFSMKLFLNFRDFSYGAYLIHFPLINFCFLLGFFQRHIYIGFLLICFVSFLFSFLIEYLFLLFRRNKK